MGGIPIYILLFKWGEVMVVIIIQLGEEKRKKRKRKRQKEEGRKDTAIFVPPTQQPLNRPKKKEMMSLVLLFTCSHVHTHLDAASFFFVTIVDHENWSNLNSLSSCMYIWKELCEKRKTTTCEAIFTSSHTTWSPHSLYSLRGIFLINFFLFVYSTCTKHVQYN